MVEHLRRDTLTKRNADSLAMDISALAISEGNSSSERTKLDRDLFAEVLGSGRKRVPVDGSVGSKEVEETKETSPSEGWRSWMAGGSLNLLREVGGGGVVVAVVIVVVGGGGRGIVEVIFLSLSSSSLALVVAMVSSAVVIDRSLIRATMDGDSPTTLIHPKAAPSVSALSTDSATAVATSFRAATQTIHEPEAALPPMSSSLITR